MKKTAILLSTVLFSGLLMVSCKKDYTCTCSLTAGGATQTTTTPIDNTTKGNAEDACEGIETTANTNGITGECSLD